MTREARLVWRSENEVGVAFALPPLADEKKPDNEAAALRRRIRELEREVAQLRGRVLELSAG